jgi:hypothetical protein
MHHVWLPNNAINTDSKKRRAFVAPLFTAGYGGRWVAVQLPNTVNQKEKSLCVIKP